jgi:adenylate cyclase class 2
VLTHEKHMYEVEIKVRADHDSVRGALENREAAVLNTVTQADTYYDAPMREFAETDEALRVRRERADSEDGRSRSRDAETAKLTYKGPLVDESSKTREEHETAVEDAAAIEATLDALGFEPVATVEKRRERFAIDGYTVSLDVVTDLGEFVEIEKVVEEAEIDEAREGAVAVLESLDLDPEEGIRTSYLGLLLADAQ